MRALGVVTRCSVTAAVVLLSACGGGGGGGGGGGAAPPAPVADVIGQAAEYWSPDGHNVWVFDGRDNAQQTAYRNRVTIGVPWMLAGRTLVSFDFTRPFNDPTVAGPQYRSLEPDGIRAYLEEMPTDVTDAYLELRAQIRRETYRAYDQPTPVGGGTGRLTIDVTIVGFESLSLPIGTLTDTLKSTQRITLTTNSGGQSTSTTLLLATWYAKGIGPVKQVLDDPTAPVTSNTYVEELAGVIVPGIKAGVISGLTLFGELAPGQTGVITGQPGVASDGSGYLIATRKIDAVADTEIVATYLDANGQVVWTKPVITELGSASLGNAYPDPVAVAFDGTNFWIVARSSEMNSTTLLRQRVSPVGVLADPPGGTVLGNGVWPALGSNGTTILFVNSRNLGFPSFDWAMYATLYDSNAAAFRAEQLIALPGSGNSGFASIAANGGQYLVSLEIESLGTGSRRDVQALRIDGTGTVLDSPPIAVGAAANDQVGSAVAPWGSVDFVAAWLDSRDTLSNFGQYDVFGARVSASGLLLDGPAETGGVALNRRATERFGVAAATGATGTLLAWTIGSYANLTAEPTGVFARRFAAGATLTVADPTTSGTLIGLVTTAEDFGVRLMEPATAASGSGHLVVWVYNSASSSVRGALVFPLVGGP